VTTGSTERRLPFDSAVATGRGDDGTTGLLFGGERIAKDDPRTEAYGTVDEAVAALGLARADLAMKDRYGAMSRSFGTLDETILRLQRELFVVGAELATTPGAGDRQEAGRTRVSAEMVDGLGRLVVDLEAHVSMPREFVVPGETRISAALELARTVIRRAERRAVTLRRNGLLSEGSLVVPYLNRLADLAWILARAAEQAESRPARMARSSSRQTRRATVDEDAVGHPSDVPARARQEGSIPGGHQ
jgi:cob(I)alamin adenosyltransferase